MFKYLFGCFNPASRPVNVHPKPRTPVPTPIPSPTPVVAAKPPPTTVQTMDTLEALQGEETNLHKRIEVLETQIAKLKGQAKAYNLEGKRDHALLCLKKSKMLEKSVVAVGNMITKVAEQQIAFGNAQTLSETIVAISGAARATQGVMKGHRIDQVDELMEDIQDNEDHLQEVNERLAEPTGVLEGFDDDALMAELEAELENDGMLAEVEEADVLNNRSPEVPVLREAKTVDAALPPAPTHPIETKSRNKSVTRQNLNLERT